MDKKSILAASTKELFRFTFEPIVTYLPVEYAKGCVKKTLVYQSAAKPGEITEVALLELDAGAEILQHKHTIDEEVYIIRGDDIRTCKRGESHGYLNTTDKVKEIVAIKFAV